MCYLVPAQYDHRSSMPRILMMPISVRAVRLVLDAADNEAIGSLCVTKMRRAEVQGAAKVGNRALHVFIFNLNERRERFRDVLGTGLNHDRLPGTIDLSRIHQTNPSYRQRHGYPTGIVFTVNAAPVREPDNSLI